MTIWFSKVNNGIKDYKSKSFTICFRYEHWRTLYIGENRPKKGDPWHVYDFNICFLGIVICYTNWDYNR